MLANLPRGKRHHDYVSYDMVRAYWDGKERSFEEVVLDSYAQGGSDTDLKLIVRANTPHYLSHKLWDRWLKEEPEFLELLEEGRALSQAWWENVGKDYTVYTQGKGYKRIDHNIWRLNMKNRFKWTDRHEFTGADGKELINKGGGR